MAEMKSKNKLEKEGNPEKAGTQTHTHLHIHTYMGTNKKITCRSFR